MSKQECARPHCTGKADDSGACWRHRPRKPTAPKCRKCKARLTSPKCHECGTFTTSTVPVENAPRRAKSFARNYGSKARVEWLKSGGCEVYREAFARAGVTMDTAPWPDWWRCDGPLDAMHVRARGMGGAKGDASDMVCGCRKHHRLAGELGTSQRAKFEARSGLDLVAIADMRDREWRALVAAQEGRAEP